MRRAARPLAAAMTASVSAAAWGQAALRKDQGTDGRVPSLQAGARGGRQSAVPTGWREGRAANGRPYRLRFAASTTCLQSTVEVTFPTPPGTGVRAAARGSASSKRRSPQSFCFASFQPMPTSIKI